jgi:hypothetical protein
MGHSRPVTGMLMLTKTLRKVDLLGRDAVLSVQNYKVSAVYAASFFRVEGTIRTLSLTSFFTQAA